MNQEEAVGWQTGRSAVIEPLGVADVEGLGIADAGGCGPAEKAEQKKGNAGGFAGGEG